MNLLLRLTWLILVALTIGITPAQAGNPARIVAGFTPGNAESLVVSAINDARSSILVAAYSFTSKPIAQALINAQKRGVKVAVVLDKSNRTAKYSAATFLANMRVPVRINAAYAIMHNKFMILDGKTVFRRYVMIYHYLMLSAGLAFFLGCVGIACYEYRLAHNLFGLSGIFLLIALLCPEYAIKDFLAESAFVLMFWSLSGLYMKRPKTPDVDNISADE